MKRIAIPMFFVVTILVTYGVRPYLSAQTKQEPRRVRTEEIGKAVILIGSLGMPLGEPFQFTGRWHFPPTPDEKDDSIRFSVVSVNGQALKNPVEFNHEQLDFTDPDHRNAIPARSSHRDLDGQLWTLTGYETGRIQLFPNEEQSKSPMFPVVGRPYYTKPFTSELYGIVTQKGGRIQP